MPVLGLSTIGVGLLLAVAGLLADSTAALMSDLAIGGFLIVTGALLHHRGRRTLTPASTQTVTSPS